ncbi:hypothetical protein [Streptococcus loxodontisalivarius]|uniref:YfhO family protein n=1 Tax=Streptococcus loxodontisalivarius TaxID=1349415 RepID=A0ABS2PS44_9STRE|nr:hypothetical protein [Streptococcus loxodontisalivarius]MBM7642852.1 hypothetical protein [Streptococcus loxodontisalivarius]
MRKEREFIQKGFSLLEKDRFVYLFFAIFSLLLMLVPIVERSVPTGWDLSFHYNRFYETAMQIKEGNYSYFTMLYGFNSTGRIINALYGPLFAYINGLLVLISGTWYRYFLISSWLLYFLSSLNMYICLKKLEVKQSYNILLSLFFAVSYPLVSWMTNQGFRTWGIIFFPLCLLPVLLYMKTGRLNKWGLAISVGLMTQVHLLSTLFLLTIYLFVFSASWIKSSQKWVDFKLLLQSIVIFLLLTPNIWLSFLHLYTANDIIPVYVNETFLTDTLNMYARTHFAPKSTVILMVLQFVLSLIWLLQKRGRRLLYLSLIYAIFLCLSTNLFPWQLLAGKGYGIVELIQFPHRFFDYAIVLLLISLGLFLTAYPLPKWQKVCTCFLLAFSVLYGVGHVYLGSLRRYDNFMTRDYYIKVSVSESDFRRAVNSTDLSEFIEMTEAYMADYLPSYEEGGVALDSATSKHYYNMYRAAVINNPQDFKISVNKGSISYEWTSESVKKTTLPLVIYHNSQLSIDGKLYTPEQLHLSEIGMPIVESQIGKHKAVLTYQNPIWLLPSLILTLLMWCLSFYKLKNHA